jgi:hypothetical protein
VAICLPHEDQQRDKLRLVVGFLQPALLAVGEPPGGVELCGVGHLLVISLPLYLPREAISLGTAGTSV